MLQPAVFLDRDGVIVENRANYVLSWADVSFIPGALKALRRLGSSPYRIIIITNQSAVGRGILTLEQAQEINKRLITVIERAGGRIDAVYMCPHAPWDNCTCRKPQPGLIIDAVNDLGINLSTSMIIGDAFSDLDAGKAAGIPSRILVLTGRGKAQLDRSKPNDMEPLTVHNSLLEAVEAFIDK